MKPGHWMLDGEEVGVFDVPGPPVAKQRPRRSKDGHWYTPPATVQYEATVAWCAQAAGLKLEPKTKYGVEIVMHLTTRRFDIDNAAKAVLDGMGQLPNWNDIQVRCLLVREVSVKDPNAEQTMVRVTLR